MNLLIAGYAVFNVQHIFALRLIGADYVNKQLCPPS
jgi:hypothetical protein